MITRLWRGEVALWKTFWLFGAGGGIILGLPIFATMLALTDVPDDRTATVILAALGILLIYLVWVSVGIWRAAGRYPGDPAWAVLAKLAVGFEVAIIIILAAAVLFADTG
jgi:hypothetical protein